MLVADVSTMEEATQILKAQGVTPDYWGTAAQRFVYCMDNNDIAGAKANWPSACSEMKAGGQVAKAELGGRWRGQQLGGVKA